MSYNTPTVFAIPNPEGLDLAIYDIQQRLGELTWLTKVFGRAWIMEDFEGTGDRRVTTSDGIKPKLFTGKNVAGNDAEYIDALPNDYLDSYSFFVAEGPETPLEYSNTSRNLVTRPMSLIVWARLDKVDSAKTYPYTEVLKKELYSKLKKFGARIQITSYVDDTREVWQGFDWTNVDNKNLRYPNMGMRIFFDLTYPESC